MFVMVWAWVGKEFPERRQNEREIQFIRVGDAVRTLGQLKGEPMFEQGSLVHFYTQGTRSGIGVLWVICCLDEARILNGRRGKREANFFSLRGRRGDRLYCSGEPEIC